MVKLFMSKYLGLLIVCITSFLFSCTRESNTTRMKVQLPISSSLQTPNPITRQNTTGSMWGISPPTTINDINCYGIAVALPDATLNPGKCSHLDGTDAFRFHLMKAAVPEGSQIDLIVPSGPNRTLYLIGFVSNAITSCASFDFTGPDSANLSPPRVISKVLVDLSPGEQQIQMTASLTNSLEFESCDQMQVSPPTTSPPPPTTTNPTITLSPPIKTLGLSDSFQFNVINGVGPYSFNISLGGGNIDNIGFFNAPPSEGISVIDVTDTSSGAQSTATVKIVDIGSPDNNFNPTATGIGLGEYNLGFTELQGNDMVVLEDGKMIVVGKVLNAGYSDNLVMKLLPDGTLDPSFAGGGGFLVFDGGGSIDDSANAVGIQSNGKIVIAGKRESGMYKDGFIARLNPDGSFDNTFNGNVTGYLSFIDINGNNEEFFDLVILPDDRILLAGYATIAGYTKLLLGIKSANGTNDPVGFNQFSISAANDKGKALFVDLPTGKFYVAGEANGPSASTSGFVSRHHLSDLNLDPSFASSGKFIFQSSGNETAFETIAMQSNGFIIAGGHRFDGNEDGVMIRLDSSGTLDVGFGISGEVSNYYSTNNDRIQKILIQKDDKIVAVGNKLISGNEALILKYLPNGTLDTGFAGTGEFIYSTGSNFHRLFGLAFGPDGFIHSCGYFNSTSGVLDGVSSKLGIIKIKNDGN